MSEALYNKMRERWSDFLTLKSYLAEPRDLDHLDELYDTLVDDFCENYDYSDKTKAFAFHGQWSDTFRDDYYKILEKEGWEGFALCDEGGNNEKDL